MADEVTPEENELSQATAEVARLQAENDQLAQNKEAVDLMRQRMAVAKEHNPEGYRHAEAVLRNTKYTPEAAAPVTHATLPDDLDDRERAMMSAMASANVEAVREILAAELGPIRQRQQMAALEDQTKSLMGSFEDRVKAKPDVVRGLLEDPSAQAEGIDRAFMAADYRDLHAENQALRQQIADGQAAEQVEAQRQAGIMKLAGTGGRSAVGAPPTDDPKVKFKDSNNKMHDILLHNLGLA